MAGRGWVYDAPFWHADPGGTYEEWVQGVRGQGWQLWLPVVDGRMTYGVSVRRWDGPGLEPPPTWGPDEGPAE